jgi:uncharacterized protein DUF4136
MTEAPIATCNEARRGRKSTVGFLVVLALVASGCTQFDVRSRQDPNVEFGRLRRYAWLPASEAEPADQRVNDRAIDARIRAAVDRELRAKGYVAADSGPADFLLNYRVSTSPNDVLVGNRPGYVVDLWYGWPGAQTVYDNHDVGTLYLAALDRETKRMIWVGAAQARLLPHISYEKRATRVDAAVKKIMSSFPAH